MYFLLIIKFYKVNNNFSQLSACNYKEEINIFNSNPKIKYEKLSWKSMRFLRPTFNFRTSSTSKYIYHFNQDLRIPAVTQIQYLCSYINDPTIMV